MLHAQFCGLSLVKGINNKFMFLDVLGLKLSHFLFLLGQVKMLPTKEHCSDAPTRAVIVDTVSWVIKCNQDPNYLIFLVLDYHTSRITERRCLCSPR